jgi:hypothetical protein
MRRTWFVVIGCLAIAGCHEQARVTENATENAIAVDVIPAQAAKAMAQEALDREQHERLKAIQTSLHDDADVIWESVTKSPVKIAHGPPELCSAGRTDGPHWKPSIVVRTNPTALNAFVDKQSPMPVGSIVLKEKHEEDDAADPPNEFGAMIKREAGYDPDFGDWEYVYGTVSPLSLKRGKLTNCIVCHSAYAKTTDYLFRSYLPDEKAPEEVASGR